MLQLFPGFMTAYDLYKMIDSLFWEMEGPGFTKMIKAFVHRNKLVQHIKKWSGTASHGCFISFGIQQALRTSTFRYIHNGTISPTHMPSFFSQKHGAHIFDWKLKAPLFIQNPVSLKALFFARCVKYSNLQRLISVHVSANVSHTWNSSTVIWLLVVKKDALIVYKLSHMVV